MKSNFLYLCLFSHLSLYFCYHFYTFIIKVRFKFGEVDTVERT